MQALTESGSLEEHLLVSAFCQEAEIDFLGPCVGRRRGSGALRSATIDWRRSHTRAVLRYRGHARNLLPRLRSTDCKADRTGVAVQASPTQRQKQNLDRIDRVRIQAPRR